MKLRYLHLLALNLLLLTSCGSAVQHSLPKLDKGVGGYEGEVFAFTVPYTLPYGPGPETLHRTIRTTRVSDTKGRRSYVLRSKISTDGEERIWKIAVEEANFGGGTLRSVSPPLLIVRGQGSLKGPIEDIDLSFPYFRQEGLDAPTDSSDMFRAWPDLLRELSFMVPATPIAMNTELIPPRRLLDLINKSDGLPEEGQKMILEGTQRNTMSARVVGETYDNGVHCLVAMLDGGVVGKLTFTSFEVNLRGHWLINARTGMSHRAAMFLDVSWQNANESDKIVSYTEMRPDSAAER